MTNAQQREPMLDLFIFETNTLIEQLEQAILSSEKNYQIDDSVINEIFRIMHTIKGSAAMMMFNGITAMAHSMEDLFYSIREDKPTNLDYSYLCDLVLDGSDFIKKQIISLENNEDLEDNPQELVENIQLFLNSLHELNLQSPSTKDEGTPKCQNEVKPRFYISAAKNGLEQNVITYQAHIFFEQGCAMENIRAFNVVHKLKLMAEVIQHFPPEIIDNDSSASFIKENGFIVDFNTRYSSEEIKTFLLNSDLVRDLQLRAIENHHCINQYEQKGADQNTYLPVNTKSMISVDIHKLDKLMNLVGELVTSTAMGNLDSESAAKGNLISFPKNNHQHRKIVRELQDVVMSIRMVPLTNTFQKMNRLVRDMGKKLDKEIELEILGDETEVDKNILEHLSDPLMHLIRNAIDHGIEGYEQRLSKGKPVRGKIRLEAKSEGGDVWIIIEDDGSGLDKHKILTRACRSGLIERTEVQLTDQQIFDLILLPGFSTRDEVNEFSGRGVGMDVVAQNLKIIGGSVKIDSIAGVRTTVSLKIPLTLAIIDGMAIKIGTETYILPTRSIRKSYRARKEELIKDPDGNEMLMIRGVCYPILRLHQRYRIPTNISEIPDGIIVLVENDCRKIGLFADALLGEGQVVVQALPKYLKRINGIGGCTLLANGQTSLIIDVPGLMMH